MLALRRVLPRLPYELAQDPFELARLRCELVSLARESHQPQRVVE